MLGAKARPEGPRAGVGFLKRGQAAPPYQIGGLGSAVSSPSEVRDKALAPKWFSCILEASDSVSCCFVRSTKGTGKFPVNRYRFSTKHNGQN